MYWPWIVVWIVDGLLLAGLLALRYRCLKHRDIDDLLPLLSEPITLTLKLCVAKPELFFGAAVLVNVVIVALWGVLDGVGFEGTVDLPVFSKELPFVPLIGIAGPIMTWLYLKRAILLAMFYRPKQLSRSFLKPAELPSISEDSELALQRARHWWPLVFGKWRDTVLSVLFSAVVQSLMLRFILFDELHSFCEVEKGRLSALGLYVVVSVGVYSYWASNFGFGIMQDARYLRRVMNPRIKADVEQERGLYANVFAAEGCGGLSCVGKVTIRSVWLWIVAGATIGAAVYINLRQDRLMQTSVWAWIPLYISITLFVWYPALCARASARRTKLRALQPWHEYKARLLLKTDTIETEPGTGFDEVERRIKGIRNLNEWPFRVQGLIAAVAQLAVIVQQLSGVVEALSRSAGPG